MLAEGLRLTRYTAHDLWINVTNVAHQLRVDADYFDADIRAARWPVWVGPWTPADGHAAAQRWREDADTVESCVPARIAATPTEECVEWGDGLHRLARATITHHAARQVWHCVGAAARQREVDAMFMREYVERGQWADDPVVAMHRVALWELDAQALCAVAPVVPAETDEVGWQYGTTVKRTSLYMRHAIAPSWGRLFAAQGGSDVQLWVEGSRFTEGEGIAHAR